MSDDYEISAQISADDSGFMNAINNVIGGLDEMSGVLGNTMEEIKGTFEGLASSFENISSRSKVWGDSVDELSEKKESLKATINSLISQGFDPEDEKIQLLKSRYDELTKAQEDNKQKTEIATRDNKEGLEAWGISLDTLGEKGTEVFKQFGIDLDQFSHKSGISTESLLGVGSAVAISVEAIKKLSEVLSECVSEFSEDETAQLRFNAALASSKVITTEQGKELGELAEKTGLVTGQSTAATQSQIAMLAATGRTSEQIDKMVTAAEGLSVATGVDLNTALTQINVTFSGTAGRLTRMTPELKTLTKEQLENGDAVNILNEKYGKLSTSLSGSTAVLTANIKNQWGEVKAAIGEVVQSGLRPFEEMWLKVAQSINAAVGAQKAFKEALATSGTAKATPSGEILLAQKERNNLEQEINNLQSGTRFSRNPEADIKADRERIASLNDYIFKLEEQKTLEKTAAETKTEAAKKAAEDAARQTEITKERLALEKSFIDTQSEIDRQVESNIITVSEGEKQKTDALKTEMDGLTGIINKYGLLSGATVTARDKITESYISAREKNVSINDAETEATNKAISERSAAYAKYFSDLKEKYGNLPMQQLLAREKENKQLQDAMNANMLTIQEMADAQDKIEADRAAKASARLYEFAKNKELLGGVGDSGTPQVQNQVSDINRNQHLSGVGSLQEGKKYLETYISQLEKSGEVGSENYKKAKKELEDIQKEINKLGVETRMLQELPEVITESGYAANALVGEINNVSKAVVGLLTGDVSQIKKIIVGTIDYILDQADHMLPVLVNIGKDIVAAQFDEGSEEQSNAIASYSRQAAIVQAAMTVIGKSIKTIKGVVSDVIDTVYGVFKDGFKLVEDVVSGTITSVKSTIGGLGTIISGVFSAIGSVASWAWDMLKAMADFDIGEAYTNFKTFATGLYDFFAVDMLKMPEYVKMAFDYINSLMDNFSGNFEDFYGQISQAITDSLTMISEKAPAVITFVLGILDGFVHVLINKSPQILDVGLGLVDSLLAGIASGMPGLVTEAENVIHELIVSINKHIPGISESGKSIINSLLSGITTSGPLVVTEIVTLISGLLIFISDEMPAFVSAGILLLDALLSGVITELPKLISSVIGSIGSIADKINEYLPTFITNGEEILGSLISGLASAGPKVVTTLVNMVSALLKILIDELPDFVSAGMELISALLEGINANIGSIVSSLGISIKSSLQTIQTNLPGFIAIGSSIIEKIVTGLEKDGPSIALSAGEILGSLATFILNSATTFIPVAGEIIASLITGFSEHADEFISGISMFISTIGKTIGTHAEEIADFVTAIFQMVVNLLPTIITDLLPPIVKILLKALPDIAIALIGALPSIVEALFSILPELIPDLTVALGKLVQAGFQLQYYLMVGVWISMGKGLVDGIIKGVNEGPAFWDSVKDWFNGIITGIKNFFGIASPSTSFYGFGANIIAGMINGINGPDLWAGVSSTFTNLWTNITGIFSGIGSWFQQTFDFVFGDKLWTNVGKYFTGLWREISNLFSGVGSWFQNAFNFVFGDKLWSNVSKTFSDLWTNITGIFSGVSTWFSTTFGAIAGALKAPLNAVIAVFNGVIAQFNKIRVDIPGWVPLLGGQSFGISLPTIPYLEKGTKDFEGGYAMVGEKGAELVNLPKHAQVTNAGDTSRELASLNNKSNNGSANKSITVNLTAGEKVSLAQARREAYKLSRSLAFGV